MKIYSDEFGTSMLADIKNNFEDNLVRYFVNRINKFADAERHSNI